MRKTLCALLLGMAPLTALQAQSMSVATFLSKAEALQKKGPLALLSGDMGLLKAEIQNSAKAYGADVRAAREAGKTPPGCPPVGSTLSMNSDELLSHFRAIPPAQRSMSVKAAFYRLMQNKYPCRG